MPKTVTYAKDYDIDAALAAQGSSIANIQAAIAGLNAFMVFAKALDSELKDKVLQKAFTDNDPIVSGFKQLRDGLEEFLKVGDDFSDSEGIEDPDALINIKREVNLTLNKKTYTESGFVGRVFEGERNSDKQAFIKLEAEYGNYFWNDDLANWNEDVSVHPEDEPRWVKARDFKW